MILNNISIIVSVAVAVGVAAVVEVASATVSLGRGDMVGNPHRAQICQLELFEFILVLKLDKQFSIEQFEATVSQSTVSSPPLTVAAGMVAVVEVVSAAVSLLKQ